MFLVNGSVKTEGSDNFLPIDMMYGYKRYATRVVLQPYAIETKDIIDPESNKIIGQERIDTNVTITDISPFEHTVTSKNINLSDEDICIFGNTDPDLVPLRGKSSFKFNGDDSYMEVASNGIVCVDKLFTISLWFNTLMISNVNGVSRTLFALGNTTNGLILTLSDATGTVANYVSLKDYTGGNLISSTSIDVADGKWHNVCITRDQGDIIHLFVDGKEEGTISNTTPYGHLVNSSLKIGRSFTEAGYFNGLMDDIYLLNGVCEHTTDFDLPEIKYMVPLETENDYSGMVMHVKIAEDIKKNDLLYYEQANRAYRKADATDIKKMPARGIALEDGFSGDKIKVLTYGTIATNTNEFAGEDLEFNSVLPVLSSTNSYDSFTVTASSGTPQNMFNSRKENETLAANKYYLPGTTLNNSLHWLKIKLNKPIKVCYYSIRVRDVNTGTIIPDDKPVNHIPSFKFKGSLDNNNWKLLDSQSNLTWKSSEEKIFTINNPQECQYYEFFDMTINNGINSIKLYDELFNEVIPDFSGDYCYIYDSTNDGINKGYKVSDGYDNTYWSPASNGMYGDLIFDFGFTYDPVNFNHVNVKSFNLICDNSNNGMGIFIPAKFLMYGSDNNRDWDELYNFQIDGAGSSPWMAYGDSVNFVLEEITHYRYYKLSIQGCHRILPGGTPTTFKLVGVELLDNDGNNILPKFRNRNRALLGKLNYDGLEVYDMNNHSIQEPYLMLNDSMYDRDGWQLDSQAPSNIAAAATTYLNIAANSQPDDQRIIIKCDRPRKLAKFTIVPRLAQSNARITNTTQLQNFGGACTLSTTNNAGATGANRYGMASAYHPVIVAVFAKNEGDASWTAIDQAHISGVSSTQVVYSSPRSESNDVVCSVTANINEYDYYSFILRTAEAKQSSTVYVQQLRLFDDTGTEFYGDVKYEGYWERDRAKIQIKATDELTGNYTGVRQLLNPQWEFNLSDNKNFEYSTNPDVFDPIITISLPNKTHTLYDRRIDGYILTSMYNIDNPNSFRYPRKWKLEGFNGTEWIILDEQDGIIYNKSNERKEFKLDKIYDDLEEIKLSILDTGGSILVAAPTNLSIKEFYPTFNDQMIEIPAFGYLSTDYKYLNKYSLVNKSGETWEIESSSEYICLNGNQTAAVSNGLAGRTQSGLIYPEYAADVAFSRLNKDTANCSCCWYPITMEQSLESHTYAGSTGTIRIELKQPTRLYAYGMFFTPHALCGAYESVKAWELYGSNDNVNWDMIDRVSPVTDEMATRSWPLKCKVDAKKSYRIFKFKLLIPGSLYGIEFYEQNSIKATQSLAISANEPGKMSTVENLNNYNTETTSHYIQNIGYTGLTFTTAEEEYSVKFFDFNKQITPATPNQGLVNITNDTYIGHNIEDGPMVTYLCDSLRIQPSMTLTTNVRCRGLRIIVKGDCIIDGTLSMDRRGPNYSPFWTEDFPIIDERGRILGYIPRYGADGGVILPYRSGTLTGTKLGTATALASVLQNGNHGVVGGNGVNRATGGGGSGAQVYYTGIYTAGEGSIRGGNGGRGTCFAGGCGGGSQAEYLNAAAAATQVGKMPLNRVSASPAINDAGCGGHSISYYSPRFVNAAGTDVAGTVATGAKNMAGVGPNFGRNINFLNNNNATSAPPVTTDLYAALPAATGYGSGGLIILIVYGNLTINVRGKISSCGSYFTPTAGNAAGVTANNACVSGGGSGGGSINIFYGGRYINNGTITAAGGQRITNSYISAYGGNGGDGCITIDRLS